MSIILKPFQLSKSVIPYYTDAHFTAGVPIFHPTDAG